MYQGLFATTGAPLTVGLGLPGEWETAADSCRSAVNALRARTALGPGGMIDAAAYGARLESPHNMIPVNDEKKLLLALELGEEEKAAEHTAALLEGAPARGGNSLLSLHAVALELAELFFSAAKRKGVAQLPADETALLRALDDCATPDSMEKLLTQTARSFAAAFRSACGGEDKAVRQIKQYVAVHYREDIALNDLARLVCLSPNYVSELFKKQTGENFSEYLMDYRIAIAKDLLRDVKYKVVDVAEMVGYTDPKYFSRVFKKRVGVNPNAYKKLYS